jgi:hypothetical protein
MSKTTAGVAPMVRLSKENQLRLEKVQELGFVPGTFVNEVLEAHIDGYLHDKAKKLHDALQKALKPAR